MPNCAICGKSVMSGVVLHSDCYNHLKRFEKTDAYKTFLENAKLKIKLVKLEEKDRWIPCSERLPGKEEIFNNYSEFLVTISDACGVTTLYFCKERKEWQDINNEVYNVVAWRELPKRYGVD